ncbi:MAG: hypothetical protein HY791_36690 [Deltaproteobacteria bacterium]|nr:hypothetical protein [Deltaproteobacteria bacterium]
MARNQRRLGGLFQRLGFVDEWQLDSALEEQEQSGRGLCDILAKAGIASEDRLVHALAKSLGLDMVEGPNVAPAPEVLALIPAGTARRHRIVPLGVITTEGGQRRLNIITADPLDQLAFQAVRACVEPSDEVRWTLIRESEMGALLDRLYEHQPSMPSQPPPDPRASGAAVGAPVVGHVPVGAPATSGVAPIAPVLSGTPTPAQPGGPSSSSSVPVRVIQGSPVARQAPSTPRREPEQVARKEVSEPNKPARYVRASRPPPPPARPPEVVTQGTLRSGASPAPSGSSRPWAVARPADDEASQLARVALRRVPRSLEDEPSAANRRVKLDSEIPRRDRRSPLEFLRPQPNARRRISVGPGEEILEVTEVVDSDEIIEPSELDVVPASEPPPPLVQNPALRQAIPRSDSIPIDVEEEIVAGEIVEEPEQVWPLAQSEGSWADQLTPAGRQSVIPAAPEPKVEELPEAPRSAAVATEPQDVLPEVEIEDAEETRSSARLAEVDDTAATVEVVALSDEAPDPGGHSQVGGDALGPAEAPVELEAIVGEGPSSDAPVELIAVVQEGPSSEPPIELDAPVQEEPAEARAAVTEEAPEAPIELEAIVQEEPLAEAPVDLEAVVQEEAPVELEAVLQAEALAEAPVELEAVVRVEPLAEAPVELEAVAQEEAPAEAQSDLEAVLRQETPAEAPVELEAVQEHLVAGEPVPEGRGDPEAVIQRPRSKTPAPSEAVLAPAPETVADAMIEDLGAREVAAEPLPETPVDVPFEDEPIEAAQPAADLATAELVGPPPSPDQLVEIRSPVEFNPRQDRSTENSFDRSTDESNIEAAASELLAAPAQDVALTPLGVTREATDDSSLDAVAVDVDDLSEPTEVRVEEVASNELRDESALAQAPHPTAEYLDGGSQDAPAPPPLQEVLLEQERTEAEERARSLAELRQSLDDLLLGKELPMGTERRLLRVVATVLWEEGFFDDGRLLSAVARIAEWDS